MPSVIYAICNKCRLFYATLRSIAKACAVLTALLHLCRFTKQGILIHEQIHCDITGKVVRASENSDQAISELEQKYRKRPVAIGWHECRHLLFDQLPSSTVEFDKQVTAKLFTGVPANCSCQVPTRCASTPSLISKCSCASFTD